jgi:hypothetical protein
MCEPTTLAMVAFGFNALGTTQRAQAQRAAGEANAQILEADARTAESAAGDSIARGQAGATRLLVDSSRFIGKQKASYAAAGVDTQSGSPLDVLSDSAGLSELDAKLIETNAAREAWGYKTQAGDFRRRAALSRQGGDAAAEATVLGGIGSSAQMLYPMLRIGGPPPMAGQRPGYDDYNDQGI